MRRLVSVILVILGLAAALPAVAADDAVAPVLEAFKAGRFEKVVELASKVPERDAARPRALYLPQRFAKTL